MLRELLSAFTPTPDAPVDAPAPEPPSKLLEEIARPIPGANPCGEDATYDADFIALVEEIERAQSIGAGVDHERAAKLREQLAGDGTRGSRNGAPPAADAASAPPAGGMDAELVVTLARRILTERSKDLRVVCHLAYGLARRDGVSGVADGVAALDVLARTFWDGAYPPLRRMTARKNAIETAAARLGGVLETAPPVERDTEALARARAALDGLARFFDAQQLADLAAALRRLDDRVGEAQTRLPKGGTPPVRTPPPVRTTPPTLPKDSDGEDTPRSAAQASEAVMHAAAFLRGEDARRPLPYRLTRAQRWEPLVKEPDHDRQRTKIEPPPQVRRTYFLELHKAQQWAKLVEEGETAFAQEASFHWWLDLQRLLDAALDGLGAEHAPARDAVRWEVRRLVTRLPGLSSLAFADGRTRFADAATVDWLTGLTAGAAPAAGAGKGAASADPAAARLAEARKRVAGGDLPGALAVLQRARADDGSGRDRFVRQLHMATLCLENGQLAHARALLEELDAAAERHALDSWDPELAFQLWSRLHECYAALVARTPRGGDAPQLGRELERAFARLCRVDASRALAVAQEGRR